MADLIVNHVSRHSPEFQDVHARGTRVAVGGHVLTFERVFPHGASAAELIALDVPRPTLPLTRHVTADGRATAVDDLHQRPEGSDRSEDVDAATKDAKYLPSVLDRVRRGWHLRDPARCCGLRDQEGRDALFHAPRDRRLHCQRSPATPTRAAWRYWSRSMGTTRRRCGSRRRSTGHATSRCRRSCCTRCTAATGPRCSGGSAHPAAEPGHGARHARRHRRPGCRRADRHGVPGLLPRADIDRLVDPFTSAAAARPAGQRSRREQRRYRADQLHVLRCRGPPRRRVSRGACHPVLRARHPADLLRGTAGRGQRSGSAAPQRRGPRHQPGTAIRRTNCAGTWHARSCNHCWRCCTSATAIGRSTVHFACWPRPMPSSGSSGPMGTRSRGSTWTWRACPPR